MQIILAAAAMPADALTASDWRPTCGAHLSAAGGARFRVWAPRAKSVQVLLPRLGGTAAPMAQVGDAVYQADVPDVVDGSDYAYRLDGGLPLPDPVSRWQPAGVHGPSRLVDPAAYRWGDGAWRGLPLEALVIYELHTGTFTAQGTFAGVVARLPYLQELGVTALELMPVAEFPGSRNWGYDGVHLFAPQSTYGGPQGLKRLVDACHGAGLAVILDVVYNHLGPEGNYLHEFGPYFTDRHGTPWGPALNLDGPDSDPVRRHLIDNALYWLTEYHVDGLRLDAVHGIFDFGARHLLEELADAFHRQAETLGRKAWVIAESGLNDARVIAPRELGGWGLDAQWSDDFHHAQHVLLTGATQGYFADFGRIEHLCKALERGFVIDGVASTYRRRRHGNSSAGRPGRQFVVSVQNHDQVANPSGGLRLSHQVTPAQQKLAAALLLCAPNLPLLFMGQEFGALTPFHYFTSHGNAELARAVAQGRQREMAALQPGAGFRDPQAQETFDACRLDWACLQMEPHAGLLRFHIELLALRRTWACLHNCDKSLTRAIGHEARRWLVLQRGHADGQGALLFCNYGPGRVGIPLPQTGADWRLAIWSGDARFGEAGAGLAPPPTLHAADLPEGELELGGWHAALYLRKGAA